MANIKIGIDCHNLEGKRTGVGRYIWNLLREFSKLSGSDPDSLGVRPQQIELFLYFKNEIPGDAQSLAENSNWQVRCLNTGSNALFKHWALPRAVTKDGVDVLFCPDYVLPVRLAGNIKTALTLHDIIYEARPREYSWPSVVDRVLLKWASKRSAKKADIIFVPSEFTKKEVLKYYRVNPGKVMVTPLAPDPIFRKLNFSDGDVRYLWQGIKTRYDIGDKFILFVGSIFNRRFLPQKIEAFEGFCRRHKDVQFIIIGENHTNPYQEIRKKINAVNGRIGRRAIIWQKYVKDDTELVYLYNRAYATLWLSVYEGFGLPILESMACGTPVISTKLGSLAEVGGEAALYVKNPNDPGEIEATLGRLIEDKNYYDDLAKKGFLQAQKFSWQRTAQDTMKSILQLNGR